NATGFFVSIRRLVTGLGKNHWGLRDALFCVAFLVLLAVAARAKIAWPGRRRWPWIVFGLAIVLLPLTSGSMESDARFGLLAQPVPGSVRVLLKGVTVARVSVDGFQREEVAEPDGEEERRLAPAGCSVEIGERGVRERLGALQRGLVAGQPVQENIRADCGAL